METELFWKVNKATEENGATGEKHAPVLAVEGDGTPGNVVKVTVDVGEGKHPNENGHHIQFLVLRGNGMYLNRAELCPVTSAPVVTFSIVVPQGGVVLSAMARCNLHGLWVSDDVNVGC